MKIEFRTSGAAFEDEYANAIDNKLIKEREVIRILHCIIFDIEIEDLDHGPIMDINGNKIGSWEM